MVRLLCVLAALLSPLAAVAQVVDGDTIKLNGVTYRLWGIDAPESKQLYPDGWAAGRETSARLRDLVAGQSITCESKDTDRYGRTVGLCRVGGEDLGAILVREGLAWAFVRYSRDYITQEALAKADRLGVHAHGCLVAWEWRAQQKN